MFLCSCLSCSQGKWFVCDDESVDPDENLNNPQPEKPKEKAGSKASGKRKAVAPDSDIEELTPKEAFVSFLKIGLELPFSY